MSVHAASTTGVHTAVVAKVDLARRVRTAAGVAWVTRAVEGADARVRASRQRHRCPHHSRRRSPPRKACPRRHRCTQHRKRIKCVTPVSVHVPPAPQASTPQSSLGPAHNRTARKRVSRIAARRVAGGIGARSCRFRRPLGSTNTRRHTPHRRSQRNTHSCRHRCMNCFRCNPPRHHKCCNRPTTVWPSPHHHRRVLTQNRQHHLFAKERLSVRSRSP